MEIGMHKAKFGVLMALVALLTACNIVAPNVVPPTVVMMVITNTPDPNVIAVTVTPTGGAPAPATPDASMGAVATGQAPTFTPVVLQATNTSAVAVQSTATFGPTQTLSPFPTEVRATLYIAQQDFEHGYMFWISSQRVIWVLFNADSTGKSGEWRSYPDTFLDGEPEFDPNLNPPSANLYQPKRGFGKLWRNTAGLKDQLGWGTTPEFALNTTYVYQQGGYLDSDNKYVAQPGKHFLTTLSRQVFALSEGDHRWERVS
jgi:hypothetical protein